MDSFERQWQRWFPENGDSESKRPAAQGWTGARVLLLAGGLLALFILLNVLKGFYTEWLWFNNLGYDSVYSTILITRVLIFFVAAIVFAIVFLGNLVLAARLAPGRRAGFWPWGIVPRLRPVLKLNIILGTALLALIFGLTAESNWQVVLRTFNAQPFGVSDPVFNRDIGFYVFSLPFLHLVRGWLMGALIVTTLGSAAVYLLGYAEMRLNFDRARPVLAHLGGLAIAILGLFAWGYRLAIWELVFSRRGVVFGASYADMHAKLPAQWVLLVVVLICIVIFLVSIVRRNLRWPLYAIAAWIIAAIIVGGVFPGLVQRFQVQPNEMVREMPYIEYNIQYTREALALDRVEEQPFPAEEAPTPQDIAQNEATISNIRLWDNRPLKDTYNQIQSIRLYYDFTDIDVDRYQMDGDYRQVLIGARELSPEKLTAQAQTWVTRRLQFTHGYGVAMSPTNEVTEQGLPNLWIKDVPPIGILEIERPEIYFGEKGEKTDDYVIVGTRVEEFDYPKGDTNVYTKYAGENGIGLNSFFRRLAFAWELGDINLLISGELTPESQLLLRRNIQQRVQRLAPFLSLDRDPYIVVDNGRLYWVQDAYTTTSRFPYSQPTAGGINYIRNSVKVVTSAYDGSVNLYLIDPEDAVASTYADIFPTLFTPIEQMPESLRAHLRYPMDLFQVQVSMYETYHMQDARVFYNKEDLWTIPVETYADSERPVEPYYVIMKLPNEAREEFVLMLPLTPTQKDNMITWLAALSDGDRYGKLIAYNFPKDKLIYGPRQIEARIDQDTAISSQFTLWGQQGSQIIRGNLLVIPIEQSILYIEPIYLRAERGQLPELKRVIVASGDMIAMEPTLAESLNAIYSGLPAEKPTTPTTTPAPTVPTAGAPAEITELAQRAQEHYQRAQEYLKAGDWGKWGEELAKMEEVLQQLAEISAE